MNHIRQNLQRQTSCGYETGAVVAMLGGLSVAIRVSRCQIVHTILVVLWLSGKIWNLHAIISLDCEHGASHSP